MKDIEQLTIAEARELLPKARELLTMFGEPNQAQLNAVPTALPAPEGTEVYIRTAVYHVCGRIVGMRGKWLDLADASYVASDGRYSVATEKGLQHAPNVELERVGNGGRLSINSDLIADVAIHPGELPTETK